MQKNIGMKLSFSTLACLEWDWETVVRQAKACGYSGIEMRGLQGELETERLPMFQDDRLDDISARLREEGLALVCMDTSCDILGGENIAQTLQAGCMAIELAARLGTPYIRVFGDVIPQGMTETEALKTIAGALRVLGAHAGKLGVEVLLETHGSFANSRLPLAALELAGDGPVGLLWDSANTFEAGETVEYAWTRLKPLVKHVHVKDFAFRDGRPVPCLPGRGEVPVGRILRMLREDSYAGWVSFEWEKRWVSSIEGPEIALPAFIEYARRIYG
jgi:sugar phosphate isomerase/epimerase